jgi:hypothetical protein
MCAKGNAGDVEWHFDTQLKIEIESLQVVVDDLLASPAHCLIFITASTFSIVAF